jgi:hypothetical protein
MQHAVLQAVSMALGQRTDRNPVVLHSDRGCRFTNDEYQRFLQDHQLRSSMKESARTFECLADFSQADLFRRARPSFAPPLTIVGAPPRSVSGRKEDDRDDRGIEVVANLLRNDSPGGADFASAAWRALRELVRSPEPRGKSTDLAVRRQPNFVRRENPRPLWSAGSSAAGIHALLREISQRSAESGVENPTESGTGCGKFRRGRIRVVGW